MFGASKSVIGLDVGSYAVKAVALQSNRDRITLLGYAQAKIDNQDVGEVIRRVVDQLGLRSKRVVTAVSGRSVIVRQVETPKLADQDLRNHIAYEADKYIPFGTEEVIIDCQPMAAKPGSADNVQQVMLVAVRKGFIQEHLASLKSAGLLPEVIDVDVFALANAYELLGPPATEEAAKKATAVIDIGATKSNIAIMQADRVLFTREVYLAGNEISDAIARTLNYQADEVDTMKLAPGEALESILDAAMPALEDLANEIRLSFDYVEGQFDAEVATVVLTGGSSQLPSLANILGNILSRPVHVFDPLAGLDLVPSKYDIHGLDANSPSLTVALGLAAHVLEHDSKGLGGPNSHNWQPRARGADLSLLGTALGAGAMAAPAPLATEVEAPAPAEPLSSQGYEAPQDEGYGAQPNYSAPASEFAMPATDDGGIGVPVPPSDASEPALDPLPPMARPTDTPIDAGAKHRSGLLVVLDDDEGNQPKDPQAYTSSIRSATSTLGKGGKDQTGTQSVDLPDLPDLPGKF